MLVSVGLKQGRRPCTLVLESSLYSKVSKLWGQATFTAVLRLSERLTLAVQQVMGVSGS